MKKVMLPKIASRAFRALFAAVLLCTLAVPSVRAAAVTPPDQPVLVDTSASAGSVVESSVSATAYPASKAFDGAWSTISSDRWLAYINPNKNDYTGGLTGETPAYVTYKFNTAIKVNVLRIRIPSDKDYACSDRAPKAWTFLGSNDGSAWTTLDTRSGITWASGTTTKTFTFENHKSYEYYKFICTEIGGTNDYLQIYELQFLCDTGIVLTDLTNPNGTVTTTTTGDWVKPAKNAFDNGTKHNNDDRSIHSGTTVDWIYTFSEPTKVNAYKVYAPGTGAYFYDKRMPKMWTFQAKNAADSTWNTLDTQSSETGWSALESRYYEFHNNTAYDSYRFAVTANQSGSDNYIQIDELEFFYVNRGAPGLGETSLVRTGAQAYSLTATENTNAADLSYILDDGETVSTNGTQSVAESDSITWPISGLVANKTYQVSVLAENASGSDETVAGTLYTGELTLGATTDANENGLVAGTVAVSRNFNDPFPLTVNYTISSSATGAAEGTTWSAPTAVTIPAGETTGYLLVTPLLDPSVTDDVEVTVTLAAGNYEMPAAAAKALKIVNLVAPDGYNTWVAATDGLASVGSNWSEGHSPKSSEKVLFDGRFSSANCEWDSGASATVASWTQTNGYTGTVTFDTEFPDYAGATFTLFTISGDCVIASGKWSCRGNYNNFGASVTPMNTYKTDKRWCLNVAVGGAMTVASGTAITATGRGYGYTNGIASPAYGGYAWSGGSSPYGSIKEPFDLGLGSRSQSDQNNRISGIGGGAIKLVITGTLTLDGSIVALGTADQNIARAGGTGGSIWITANQISGAGTIDASAPTGVGNDQIVGTGSGGRIALYTQSPLTFPMANVACSGTGYRGTSWQWNSRVSGPGTIYVYDPTQTDGTLYVKQSTTVSTQNTKWTGTPVMGDLALDAVVLSGCASLRIPEGTSLTLPSLASVTTSNSGSGSAGLVYDGGTLNIGSGDQTLKANVAFSSPTAFSFPGNLTLETGAKLGSLNSMYGTAAHCYDQTFTVSVAGDLTIPTGASAGATRCCALTAGSTGRYTAAHGGQSLYLAADARTNGFDSVLNPSMPGGSMNVNFPAGGAFTLTVGGTLTLEGSMTADGGGARGNDSAYDGASAGAGGTINVTAGALAGEGKISADGGCGRYCYAGGAGGGRIAVRLTGNKAVFSDYWVTNFFSRGMSFSVDRNGKASSAGTVYLQAAGDAESAGTVVIRNDFALQSGATNNLATTRYPGNGDGCDTPAALRKTSLFVAGAAHVELTDTMRSAALEIENGSAIDLAGKVFTVNMARLGETRFPTGTYMAGDAAVAGFITDSVGGGKLVVTGGGFQLIVR